MRSLCVPVTDFLLAEPAPWADPVPGAHGLRSRKSSAWLSSCVDTGPCKLSLSRGTSSGDLGHDLLSRIWAWPLSGPLCGCRRNRGCWRADVCAPNTLGGDGQSPLYGHLLLLWCASAKSLAPVCRLILQMETSKNQKHVD